MANDTIFRIASMTKPVTSVAVMMLVQEGDIGLDDPVSEYLPAFEDEKVIENFNPADKSYTTRPAATPMTVRHLLTHTSGLGYAFSNHTLAALVGARPRRQRHALPAAARSRHALDLRREHARARHARRGSVGATARRVPVGAHLRAARHERHLLYGAGARKPAASSTVHRTTAEGLVEAPNPAEITAPVNGDGGLHSTAADYAKFIQLFLNNGRAPNGTRLLSEATVALMGENHIGAVIVEQQPAASARRSASRFRSARAATNSASASRSRARTASRSRARRAA